MYICRLFHRDRPFEQVDARLLAEGRLTIGRDPAADWPLDDPAATLSRVHCVLAVENGRLVLYDKSTNGVFLAEDARAPFDQPVLLADRDSFRLGSLSIRIEATGAGELVPSATAVLTPGWTGPTPVAQGWSEDEAGAPPASSGAHRDASLLEAFCEGARLDASALSSEDPADLMRRIGAVYQQTVLGLAAMMADRGRLKRDHALEQTTISASDNNPFEWVASRQLAQDLLCGPEAAFLTDAAAVRACFEDLSRHVAGMVAGAEATATLALTTLDPAALDAQAKGQASLLRSRSTVVCELLAAQHARLARRGVGADGSLQQAFAAAYTRASLPPEVA